MYRDFSALKNALPYIQAYQNKFFVVKLGGEVCEEIHVLEKIASEISLLSAFGLKIVVVHGGGNQATEHASKLGIESRMVQGRRVTSPEMLKAHTQAVRGELNTLLVSKFNASGLKAVGLSGVDGEILISEKRVPQDIEINGKIERIDFQQVGDIKEVHTSLLEALLLKGFTPVIASLSGGKDGEVFNVNADTIASQIAIALKAEKLIFLTAVDGVMRDIKNSATLFTELNLNQAEALIASGEISGGMIPKISNCKAALLGGVKRTHIVSGSAPDSLLTELFTNEGIGTMVVR